MKLSLMEWNIHRSGGFGHYAIPNLVVDEIIERSPDIAVVVEFITGHNWDYLRNTLEKLYYLFISPYTSGGYNQVMIALKKERKFTVKDVITVNPTEAKQPEFLQINMVVDNVDLAIIGVRIKTQGKDIVKDKKEQFAALLEQVKSIEEGRAVIIAGDFNHGAIKNESNEQFAYEGNAREDYNYQMMRRLFKNANCETHTPDYGVYGKKFSWVMRDPVIKIKEDHIIVKGVTVSNPDYKWDFVQKVNGYGELQAEDYKSGLAGLPDHAILTANIEIN